MAAIHGACLRQRPRTALPRADEARGQGIGFERRDNCLARVADVAAAQQILDSQPWDVWSTRLDDLVRRACPALLELPSFGGRPHEYYWSADETEWATDVMFRSEKQLAEGYPSLITHAMRTFSSRDVMRFLGKVRIPKAAWMSAHENKTFNVCSTEETPLRLKSCSSFKFSKIPRRSPLSHFANL